MRVEKKAKQHAHTHSSHPPSSSSPSNHQTLPHPHSLRGRYSPRFALLLFLALIAARLLTVLALSPFIRRLDPRRALSIREQLALAAAGMLRGNVSWAQALQVGEWEEDVCVCGCALPSLWSSRPQPPSSTPQPKKNTHTHTLITHSTIPQSFQ